MTDPGAAHVAGWLASQRWFAGRGRIPEPRAVGEVALADGFRILLVVDDADPADVVYQIPVDHRGVDAVGEPGFGPAVLAAMGRPGYDVGRALAVEQSNSSVVVRGPDVPAAIIKVYRVVHHGPHPEAEISQRLTEVGAPVPSHLGTLEATWTDAAGRSGGGALAVAQEFVDGPGDGWRLALEALDAGDAFLQQAEDLGRGTAELHVALAAAFPTSEPSPADRARIRVGWHGRLATAERQVPAVAENADAAAAVFDAVGDDDWPALQRVHGDLHLGQVLAASAGDPWRFTDFEGEPLRPIAERASNDLALRDVAGMLRSFGYAAASRPGAAPGWATDCSRAYLAGYDSVAHASAGERGPLLRALVLDKALYEAAYEAAHRPQWIGIPLAAIRQILESAQTPGT